MKGASELANFSVKGCLVDIEPRNHLKFAKLSWFVALQSDARRRMAAATC
jgi:hypothetical protein